MGKNDRERELRNKVDKHHVIVKSMPDNKDGYPMEVRSIERPDGKTDQIFKRPNADGTSTWQKRLGGMDLVNDGKSVALEVTIGGKKFRLLFEEV